MTARSDFDAEEWDEILKGPMYVGAYVTGADVAGIDVLMEGPALYRKATRQPVIPEAKPLIDDIVADIDRVRSDTHQLPGFDDGGDPSEPESSVMALQGIRRVAAILGARATESEAAGVKLWLMEIAGMVAEAGREGFGGFTGPRVSDKEEAALAQLRTALGL